jgi:hypothetical protein
VNTSATPSGSSFLGRTDGARYGATGQASSEPFDRRVRTPPDGRCVARGRRCETLLLGSFVRINTL